MPDIQTYPDADSLARAAAERFVGLAEDAVADRGQFVVALSGGSTPRAAYTLLASENLSRRVAWKRVHVFWGDERCVPPDHSESNYRMARETLLDRVPIPSENVHRVRGELPPHQAAAAYQGELQSVLGSVGRLDLVLLGMGKDGHLASLFPGIEAVHEQVQWVVACYVEKLSAWRVTLTPPMINSAAHIVFLVSGSGKAARLKEVLAGPYRPDVLPAQVVKPTDGSLLWMVDDAAASCLRQGTPRSSAKMPT